jgi:N-terminal region of Chorein or VPS13
MDYILQYILPSILGSFISGIDKNHMRSNFFSGKVSLQGVSLNPNLLKPLGIPVKIRYSDIGKLEVKIPWLKRLKEPIEVYLEDLSILLESMNSMEDFDIVEQRIKFLEGLEEECSAKLKGLNKEAAESDGGSLEYYKILILDNLQVSNILLPYTLAENKEYSLEI